MNTIEKDELYEMLIGSPDKQQFADILKGHEYETDSISHGNYVHSLMTEAIMQKCPVIRFR